MEALQTSIFHRFTSLPPELRIIIWEMTIEGRIVKEGCHLRGNSFSLLYRYYP